MFVECFGAPGAHNVHVLKWPSKNPSPNLPPVICVHGLTRLGTDFSDIAAKLCETRDVYSVTMPGRGKSDWLTDPMHYAYPTYVADCLFIIRETLKLTQVDWLGTSMGGLIGMWVAALDATAIRSVPSEDGTTARADSATGPALDKRDASAPNSATGPALVRKLVLNDIGPFLPLTAIQRIAFYAGRSQNFNNMDEVERHCRAIYADFGIKTDKDWRFFAEHTVRTKEGGGFTLHYDPTISKNFADVKEDVSVWPMYDTVACPTLLLRGAKSDVLSKEIAHQMTQQGPKATLVTFENCGHAPALIDAEQIKVVEQFFS